MAGPKNKLGALGALGKRLLAERPDEVALTAAQRAEAGRKAAALIKSQPQVKASEALGQQMEKGIKRVTTTQADRTRVGGGNIGGASFSAISEADPAYAGKVWGVMDEGTAARLKNLTNPETVWTTMLGSADQLKTNPVVFDKLKRQFIDSMRQGKLSSELEAKINHNLALTFGEGAQIRDPSIWKEANTFEKRAALADLMMGQGITPKKGGVPLGGEKSGKGVIFRPTDTLIKETEPTLLHPEHGGDVSTFAAGPRLFKLEKESVYRPDLHPGFPTLLTGKDLDVNMIPTPTEVFLPDWHKAFKAKKPERFQGPWARDIIERRKNKAYQLKGAEGPGYYDLALGLKGEGLPSQDLNDEYIRHLLREGFKDGGEVDMDAADARLTKAIEARMSGNGMAKGGEVDIEAADARLADAIANRNGMAGGGKVKGVAKAFKKLFVDDVVNGMRIRQDIPNQSSIGASLTDYSTHGLQEVPMSAFETVGKPRYRSVQEEKRTKELARQIQENKELNPLIVVKDAEGHYILEGGHRFDALRELDINSFPALMVHDLESLGTLAKADGGKLVKGASKVFKKLFKDDVLPAAERDANLDKFLSTSQEKRRLYHATPADFKEFQGKGFDPTISGNATWLTPNKEKQPAAHNTSSRTDVYREGVNVMPVYVKAERPLVLDDRAMEDWAKAAYANDSPEFPFLLAPEWLKKIKEDGYDSIFHPRSGEVIMLEPNKIKSAIGNRGTYDLGDPDINKADGGKIVKGLGKIGKKLFANDTLPALEREANLQKFLAESKTPMRLYHGTTATEGGKGTEAIRRIKPSKDGALGSGVYMTPNTNYSDQYTYKGSGNYEGGNTLPVYAQIKNPLVIDGSASNDPMVEALIRLGMDEAQASRMVERAYENKGYIGKEVESRARAQGYDGLMQYGKDGELGEVVSYNPNAVKSAIGNQGTYNTNVPDLSKAHGGLAHMGKGGKMSALGKLGKRLLADPDAVTPAISSGTRKFGDDSGGLNIMKETGGNWSPSGDMVYQSNLDRELDKLKKGRFDTPINVIKHHMEQDALAGNTARKAQMEQALAQAQKTEAANKWVDSNLRNYVTKQMATEGDPVRKLAEENIKAFPVNIDEYGDAELRTYGGHQAKVNRQVTGNEPKGVAQSPLAKHYETMTDEAITPTPAKRYQSIQALPPMQRPTGTMDAPWMSKLDPETPIFSLNGSTDFNKLGFDHIMDVLREDLAAGRIRPEQLNKISMEQAVRRTHEYDEAMKANMLNARIAEQANANVFKEYPEGYRWVQLDKPGQFNLESDIMGHSVRGYEPPVGHPDYTDISGNSGYDTYGHGGYEAIKSGDAKVYSLRDPKGQSHATIEVGKNGLREQFFKLPQEEKEKINSTYKGWELKLGREPTPEEHDSQLYKIMSEMGYTPTEKITQIKGKQNAAPNEAYQPYVQDFVKSGDWADVGDLSNTGLYKADPDELGMFIPSDPRLKNLPGRRTDDLRKAKEAGLFGDKKYLTRNEWEDILRKQIESESGPLPPAEGMAEGGGAFKKLQFMDKGGITTTAGTFSPEELGVSPSDLDASKYAKRISRNAADLSVEGKEQLEKEYRQLANKGAKKDALIRIGSQILGSGVDFANFGLEGLDLLQSAIPALSKPESVLDTAGTGDRVPKFRLATDEPFLGSNHFIRKFKEAKLLGENEFPLTEIVANLFAPAAAVGALKKGKQAYEGAKLLTNKPKKKQGGLTAMAR